MATSNIPLIIDWTTVRTLESGSNMNDLVNVSDSGLWYIRNNVTGAPGSYMMAFCICSPLGVCIQVGLDQVTAGGKIYIRKKLNDQSWMSWKTLTIS